MTWLAICAGFLALGFVLTIQRNAGHRMAGLCVCLPLTSGPFVLTLYLASGPDAARAAVAGSIDAIGGAAVALTVFGLLRKWPLALSAPVTFASFAAVVFAKEALVSSPFQSVLATSILVGLCAAVARGTLREPAQSQKLKPRDWRLDYLAPFVLLTLVFLIAPNLSARWSGIVASAPVLALSVLISMRFGNASARGVATVVQGSYDGLAAKLMFFVVLLALFDFEGHAWIAFGLAAVACFSGGALLWRHNVERRRALVHLPAQTI